MNTSGIWRHLKRDAAGFAALALLALLAGLGLNFLREKPLPIVYQTKADRIRREVEAIANAATNSVAPTAPTTTNTAATPPVPPTPATVTLLSLDEFKQCVERRDVLILDARPGPLYGLGHVPGALSLARDNFETAYGRLKARLEADKAQPIAVYCSDADCEDSQMVADALLKLGYQRVAVFKGGWMEWTAAQLPQEQKTP